MVGPSSPSRLQEDTVKRNHNAEVLQLIEGGMIVTDWEARRIRGTMKPVTPGGKGEGLAVESHRMLSTSGDQAYNTEVPH